MAAAAGSSNADTGVVSLFSPYDATLEKAKTLVQAVKFAETAKDQISSAEQLRLFAEWAPRETWIVKSGGAHVLTKALRTWDSDDAKTHCAYVVKALVKANLQNKMILITAGIIDALASFASFVNIVDLSPGAHVLNEICDSKSELFYLYAVPDAVDTLDHIRTQDSLYMSSDTLWKRLRASRASDDSRNYIGRYRKEARIAIQKAYKVSNKEKQVDIAITLRCFERSASKLLIREGLPNVLAYALDKWEDDEAKAHCAYAVAHQSFHNEETMLEAGILPLLVNFLYYTEPNHGSPAAYSLSILVSNCEEALQQLRLLDGVTAALEKLTECPSAKKLLVKLRDTPVLV